MSAPRSYSPLQRTLHWMTAAIVLVMLPVGFYMAWRGKTNWDDTTNALYTAHKSIGFLLLWLVAWRIGVRIARGAPPPEPNLNVMQRLAAEATHLAIYCLLLIVPVLGWIGVSAYGATGVVGGFNLPSLVAKDEAFAGRMFWLHGWAAIALMALVAAHIGAALMHRIIFKDGVFQRMWPARERR